MYSTLEKTIILKTASLFSEITAQTLSRVAQYSEEESYPAGTVVYREGDPGSAIYIVASGSVSLAVRGIELGVLRRGDPFGEVAVLNRDVYRGQATAMEDTVLLRIDQEDLFDLMQADAEIMKGIVGLLARRVVQVGSSLLDRVAGAQSGPK